MQFEFNNQGIYIKNLVIWHVIHYEAFKKFNNSESRTVSFRFSEKIMLNFEEQRISLLGFRRIKWYRNNDPRSETC